MEPEISIPPTPALGMQQLRLTHFRCFRELDITFHPQLTVLVGPNGGGKTAVLDAVSIAWQLFVDTLKLQSSSKGFDGTDFHRRIRGDGTMEIVSPVLFDATAFVDSTAFSSENSILEWSRQRTSAHATSRTTTQDAYQLKRFAERLHLQFAESFVAFNQKVVDVLTPGKQRGQVATLGSDNILKEGPILPLPSPSMTALPLMVYYGTDRLYPRDRKRRKPNAAGLPLSARMEGYDDHLKSSSNYHSFVGWFERFSRQAQSEAVTGNSWPHNAAVRLAAVKRAVNEVLGFAGWRDLEWDFAEETIVLHHGQQGRLPLDWLSDGIRNLAAMVGDIAHRAVQLNPQWGKDVVFKTPGIVLIDEVDLHLHPAWQQQIIPALCKTFPRVQFIVSTHSPQLISTVRADNIRMLKVDAQGAWTAEPPVENPYGHPNNRALQLVLDANSYPPVDVTEKLREYQDLVGLNHHDSPRAKELRSALELEWGPDDHELQIMDIAVRKNELLRNYQATQT